MTAGIPSDMRRTALVSLVAHVVALVALTTVPLTKIPPSGVSTIEVLLVSPSAPARVEQAPVPQLKPAPPHAPPKTDRKSTRLNSSHGYISYAVFCLKKKKKK